MSEGRFIVLDLETTGLDHQLEGILEIAAIELRDGAPGAVFHRLVNPGLEISPASQAIHGISAEMIADEPPVAAVLPALREFIGDSPVVAHNAPFDLNFLNRAFGLAGMAPLENPVYDTLEMAKEVLPAQRSYKLESLCLLFGHPAAGFHRALADASHLAAIFPELLRLYRQKQAWYRAQFPRIEHVAQRYDQVSRLVEDLQAELADLKRILQHYFEEHPKTRVPLPGGDSLAWQIKEHFDYDLEALLPLLEGWELADKFLKLDRPRLERWLSGDRLSDEQKLAIGQTRMKVGATQRVVKAAAPRENGEAEAAKTPQSAEPPAASAGEGA